MMSQKVQIQILTIDGLILTVVAQNLLGSLLEQKTPLARSYNEYSKPTCLRAFG